MCCSSSTMRMRVMAYCLLRDQTRQFESERGAAALALALSEHASAMCTSDRPDDVQPEPGSLDIAQASRLDTIETIEDSFELFARDADASILNANPHGVRSWRGDRDGHPHGLSRVLHCVVEEVGDNGAELLGISAHHKCAIS